MKCGVAAVEGAGVVEEEEEEVFFFLVVICGRVVKWSSGIIRTKILLLCTPSSPRGLALRFSI